jgi:hypothetical protein
MMFPEIVGLLLQAKVAYYVVDYADTILRLHFRHDADSARNSAATRRCAECRRAAREYILDSHRRGEISRVELFKLRASLHGVPVGQMADQHVEIFPGAQLRQHSATTAIRGMRSSGAKTDWVCSTVENKWRLFEASRSTLSNNNHNNKHTNINKNNNIRHLYC